ncbi:unnamed protein product, partial [Polarella glacialis]
DGLVLGAFGKNAPPRYDYPAVASTPRSPLDANFGEVGSTKDNPAQELVRKFVRDMLHGIHVTVPAAYPISERGLDGIASLDKRLKVLVLQTLSECEVDAPKCRSVPLENISSIVFGCCSTAEGRPLASETCVTLFLDEGFGATMVLDFPDLD